jgi:hypothetical protein
MAPPALAEPITRADLVLVGDGFTIHGRVTLSAEQLGLLATLDDQGWHLGWFKQKLREAGFTVTSPSVAGGSSSLLLPPSGLLDLPNVSPDASVTGGNTGGAVAQTTPVSEPTDMMLLASGLLGFAAFRRWRYAGK